MKGIYSIPIAVILAVHKYFTVFVLIPHKYLIYYKISAFWEFQDVYVHAYK